MRARGRGPLGLFGGALKVARGRAETRADHVKFGGSSRARVGPHASLESSKVSVEPVCGSRSRRAPLPTLLRRTSPLAICTPCAPQTTTRRVSRVRCDAPSSPDRCACGHLGRTCATLFGRACSLREVVGAGHSDEPWRCGGVWSLRGSTRSAGHSAGHRLRQTPEHRINAATERGLFLASTEQRADTVISWRPSSNAPRHQLPTCRRVRIRFCDAR